MPLYEYECQNCHRHVEKIQSYSAPPLEVCPHCGGKLERTISAPAVQFKGSGWYVSDYGKGGKKPDTGTKSESGGSADISGGADSKPAAGTDSASASGSPASSPKSESAPATTGGASTAAPGSTSN